MLLLFRTIITWEPLKYSSEKSTLPALSGVGVNPAATKSQLLFAKPINKASKEPSSIFNSHPNFWAIFFDISTSIPN